MEEKLTLIEDKEVLTEEKPLTQGDALRKSLMYKKKNSYDRLPAQEMESVNTYCEGYKTFLDNGKTERECTQQAIDMAEKSGFRSYIRGMELKAGDKIYSTNRGRAILLAVIGEKGLEHGINIVAAHIDSPRLDLKQNPLYEESEMAFMKTHYYGGIRKYQWVTIPLELRGVIALRSGDIVRVSIGSGVGDPQFVITDLLPHLAADQNKKTLGEAITGEGLNILVGSCPLADDDGADRVKLEVLELLNTKYGIIEEDFISAELMAVPAFNATDIGFDRAMIGAYGHDDRVCAYAGLAAMLQMDKAPTRTAVCMLADKEEIGSEGVSGMKSAAFDTFIEDLCHHQNVPLRACFEKSFCLSADVTAAFDPNYADVYEKRNSAFVNYGMGVCKYTGSRGKSGASDASAEVVAYLRRILDDASVVWQMAELGKVDKGGGGTVAAYMAERNIDTIDAGVPVLSMHSPFEVVSKLDCYMTYKGIKAVFDAK